MDRQLPYYVGVDGGGTKCRAKLYDHKGELLGEGTSGAANVARDLLKSQDSVMRAVLLAVQDANLSTSVLKTLHVAAGLAGANLPKVRAKMQAWQHPYARFEVTSDLLASCYGAHGGEDGALLIVGTGSSAVRLQNNTCNQYGGHGFLLGDQGSGAWLGRQAVASTLKAEDGIVPRSAMHQAVFAELGVSNASELVETMINAQPLEFAKLAPVVLQQAENNDVAALQIVKSGAAYLEQLCHCTLQDSGMSIVLVGGLAPAMATWFSTATKALIIPAKAGPEWGAIKLLLQPDWQT
jgi:glucosamine kinase